MRFAPLFSCAAGVALAAICAPVLAAPDAATPSPHHLANVAPLHHTPLPETAPPAPATGDWRAANAAVAQSAGSHAHHPAPAASAVPSSNTVLPDHRSHTNSDEGIHHHHMHSGGQP